MKQSIAVIVHDCKKEGGVGYVAWRQIIELSRYFKIYVITCDIPPLVNEQIYPILLMPKTWNFLRRFCHVPNELAFQLAARKALETLCSKNAISTVWCHSHSTVVLAAFPLKRRYGFSIVMTTHGDIYDRPAGTYDRLLTFYYKKVTRKAYRNSDRIQTISPYMADWAIKNGSQKERVSVIPNGTDFREIGLDDMNYSWRAPRETEQLEILYVGRMSVDKGVDILIDACSLLVGSGERVRIRIIGTGNREATLRRLVDTNNLSQHVEFLGNVPHFMLGKFYRSAHALCIPSRSEAFSLVAIEGMISGVPVIASRVGGLPYALEDGKAGCLIMPENPKELANAISMLRQQPDYFTELSKAAQSIALHKYNWASIGRALSSLVVAS
jgi:glycosyltransferase involved in cell wall biosynthesis